MQKNVRVILYCGPSIFESTKIDIDFSKITCNVYSNVTGFSEYFYLYNDELINFLNKYIPATVVIREIDLIIDNKIIKSRKTNDYTLFIRNALFHLNEIEKLIYSVCLSRTKKLPTELNLMILKFI